jgi:hypothetical protein
MCDLLCSYGRRRIFYMDSKEQGDGDDEEEEESIQPSDTEEEGIDYPDTPPSLDEDDGKEYDDIEEGEDEEEIDNVVLAIHLHDWDMLDMHGHSVDRIACLQSGKQCCICCTQVSTWMDETTGESLYLHNLSAYPNIASRADARRHELAGMVASPCGHPDHLFCFTCLRQLFLDARIYLRQGQGHILTPCPTMCINNRGDRYSFTDMNLHYFLTNREEREFLALQRRFQVYRRTATSREIDNFNHYLCIEWEDRKEMEMVPFPPLYKQDEITVSRAAQYLVRLVSNWETMPIRCKECLVHITKSTGCNTLSHCGLETCYVCGRTEVALPLNHWRSSVNPNGCPRYDNDMYWNTVARCNYQCRLDCMTDHQECKNVEHQDGIRRMHECRRRFHVRGFFTSLSPTVQNLVRQYLQARQKWEEVNRLL